MNYNICQLKQQHHGFTNSIYSNNVNLQGIYLLNNIPFNFINDKIYLDGEIGMNMKQRIFMNLAIGNNVEIKECNMKIKPIDKLEFCIKSSSREKLNINTEEFSEIIKSKLINIPIVKTNNYIIAYQPNINIFLITTKIDDEKYINIITEDTEITFLSLDNNIVIEMSNKNLFKSEFNFKEMGIGGLDEEFQIIFRRAFSTRLLPQKVLDDLNINHVRGILLYGPPGCGKTLIARKIGQILDCHEPKIVNGPSLLSKYVGESEENVRKLFQDAIEDTSGKLHLIICDEFDAICRKRGSRSDSTGINDNIVNQLLSMIDGPKSLNNILLICMTNRKDFLDEAVLRPGRLEVQIEIQLPDDKGRHDILTIHTKNMSGKQYMHNVNLYEIAKLTKNYTGAELESVVKNAVSYSLAREINPNELINKNIKPIITQDDFLKAIEEIKPMFGSKSNELSIITHNELIMNDLIQEIYNKTLETISQVKLGYKYVSLLVGPHKSGKTKLLAHIAEASECQCIKFINSDSLMHESDKGLRIYEIIDQALKTNNSIIILDSLENLIEYSPLGSIYNNKILQVIYTLLNKNIPHDKKIVFLISSSNPELMKLLSIDTLCDNMEYLE